MCCSCDCGNGLPMTLVEMLTNKYKLEYEQSSELIFAHDNESTENFKKENEKLAKEIKEKTDKRKLKRETL